MAKLLSDSTEQYFATSVGFYTNSRKMRLQRLIGERANFAPSMLWAHAAINRKSGNFSDYTDEDYQALFHNSGLDWNLRQTKTVIRAMEKVGFITKDGKLHAFPKYNSFFSKARFRKAALAKWRKKRAEEAKSNGQNGDSKKLWLIEQALKTAKGKAKRELLKQREVLLSEHTGVDLSEQPPRQQQSAPTRQPSAKKFRAVLLQSARDLVKGGNEELLTEAMVRELVLVGDTVPRAVTQKFAQLVEQLSSDKRVNPMPE